MIHCEVFSSLF